MLVSALTQQLYTSQIKGIAANYALSGQLAWTPGGPGVTFGRMMQDGIVARYLNDHCDTIKLKLCPYRNELPATADDFLWSNDSIFNKLGRFEGMDAEMEFIAAKSLTAYPLWQIEAALAATANRVSTAHCCCRNAGRTRQARCRREEGSPAIRTAFHDRDDPRPG